MRLNALKVFEKLLDEDKLLEIEGQIKFFVTIHHKKFKKNRHYPLIKEIQM